MFEGIEVTHKSWGLGKIISINDGYIEAVFSGEEKTLVFPDAIGKFLQVEDEELIEYARVESEKKEKKKKEKAEEEKKKIIENQKKTATKADASDYETPLLGNKSGDIVFSSDNDFYEAIGFLAKPGRISFFQAELTEDKEALFKKLFPNQDYKVIKTNYGKDGKVTKQGCQFRINLSNTVGCPNTLLRHVTSKGSICQINRSKFALRLVQYNGFVFGHKQNEKTIQSKVPQNYINDYLRGYNY